MHAIILAGGFGTRLKSVVSDVPKPLAPIGGRPFLALLIDVLAKNGVTGITLSVHHQWEKIRDYFVANPPPMPIGYAVEEKPLGTGGAMAYALKTYRSDAPVLVLNGDSFVRVDYPALFAQHKARNSRLTIVLREVPDTGRYGRVEVKDGIITSFGDGGAGEKGLINAGVYVMHPQLFAEPGLPEAFSFEKDFIPPRLANLKPRSFRADDYFIDIGIPEDYARACRELPGIAA
jgi:D-glycero-alpha-D-manno-heptose 1-phosphate guanylyltransferase